MQLNCGQVMELLVATEMCTYHCLVVDTAIDSWCCGRLRNDFKKIYVESFGGSVEPLIVAKFGENLVILASLFFSQNKWTPPKSKSIFV